ncbi:MAG: AMP-binding protein [Acidobacteriota bacterium]
MSAAKTLGFDLPLRRWPQEIALVDERGDSFTWQQVAESARGMLPSLLSGTSGTTDGRATDGRSTDDAPSRPPLQAPLQRTLTQPPVALRGLRHRGVVLAVWGLMDSGIPALLLHPRTPAAQVEEQLQRLPWKQQWTILGEQEALLAAEADASNAEARGGGSHSRPSSARLSGEHPLALLYTSGSSGNPKAVILSHRAFAASAAASAANLPLGPGDRWLLSLTPAHVGGLSVLTRCLLSGAAVVIDRETGSFDPHRFHRTLEERRITIASLVPTMLRHLLDATPRLAPPPELRTVLLGGAAATPALLRRALERGWPVVPTYGLTEACSQVATQDPRAVDSEGGVGRPLPGTEVRLVNEEIQLRGPTLLSGILGAEDPLSADGWLATGDFGHWDAEGRLHVLGRRGDLIITGGENVAPAAVEAVLEAHPVIAAACVFGVEDETWGQVVAAALVPAAEHRPVPSQETQKLLAVALDEHLARYQQPRRVAWLPTLALRPSGKLDRRGSAALARRQLTHFPPMP